MQALCSIRYCKSEPQVMEEGCALPWQHKAEGGNKLWRYDVRRLSMTEANICLTPSDWRTEGMEGEDRGCLRWGLDTVDGGAESFFVSICPLSHIIFSLFTSHLHYSLYSCLPTQSIREQCEEHYQSSVIYQRITAHNWYIYIKLYTEFLMLNHTWNTVWAIQ